MNPLTQVKNLQKITAREAAAGISDEASWHAKYKDSAYIFVGGLSYDLTEGDLLAVFAQYGEVVDVNLVRDKSTGKSKGFAFVAYADQRSTVLAVDNLNGASVTGRTIRVDHVANYKRKKEEDEEEERRKREERGVCYAFQRGECNRGSACKFSHDQERNANTGWGGKENGGRWQHDLYERKHGSHISQSKSNRKSYNERFEEDTDSKERDDRRNRDHLVSDERDLKHRNRRNHGNFKDERRRQHSESHNRGGTTHLREDDQGRENTSRNIDEKDKRTRDRYAKDYERSKGGDKREVESYDLSRHADKSDAKRSSEQFTRHHDMSENEFHRRHDEIKSRDHSRRHMKIKEQDGRRT
eukprot:TRINITY_DN17115_c0_g1_i1.p1 TRINITY_DN17115_c0_g1~~TRINITY_DN17115_c0_g1_i1.p1  ORF type:complete len:356 (-),score=96.22 TRINITY_DN17115_c0_g1_i1:73-1140(-)